MQTIETTRLLIRIDTHEEYLHAFQSQDDASLKAMFGIQSDADLQTQKAKVSGGLTTYRTSVRFFHLILKESNEVAGSFAYHNWFPLDKRSEIGYDMKAERYKNKGYMKEAFPFIIAHGFQAMELNRMEAFINPENTPSRRLVSAAGFQLEGLLKGRYRDNGVFTDAIVYGLMASDYQLQQAAPNVQALQHR
jgi:ribosomal-protein-alanine N-acetyltransferase